MTKPSAALATHTPLNLGGSSSRSAATTASMADAGRTYRAQQQQQPRRHRHPRAVLMAAAATVAVVALVVAAIVPTAVAELPHFEPARYIYFGVNGNVTGSSVGMVSNGAILRFDVLTMQRSTVLEKEPAGVTSLDVYDDMLYYFTSSPLYLKSLNVSDKNATPKVLLELSKDLTAWDPIISMRVTERSVYWSWGGQHSCGCVQRCALDGSSVQTVLTGVQTGWAFVVDESVPIVYASTGGHPPMCSVGGFGRKTNNFTIIQNDDGTADCEALDRDQQGKQLYFGTTQHGLRRSNPDGSHMEIITKPNQCGDIRYLFVDTAARKLYWLNGAKQYMSSDLSGDTPRVLFSLPNQAGSAPFAFGLALAPADIDFDADSS